MNDEVTVDDQAGEQPASHQSEQSAPPGVSAGAQLAALREANGWSVELVASQLNLAPRQVRALEADDHAALPGLVIVRGFIRAYAKLLRVDPAPILAAVDPAPVEAAAVLPERAPLASATFSDGGGVPFGRRGPSVPLIVAGAIVLLAILFFIAQRAGWVPSFSTEPAAVSAVQEQAVNGEAAGGDSVEPVPPEQTFADSNEEAPSSPDAAGEGAAAAAETSPAAAAPAMPAAAVAAAGQTAASESSAPAVAGGPNAIVFEVREDSWVEMRRADDSVFVSRVFKAGTTESFNLPGPISLVIGNAAGVSVSVRGQPLDVSGNASNVARLNVK